MKQIKRITMKISFITSMLLLGSMFPGYAQNNFNIEGKIDGIDKDAKVILYRVEYGGTKHDSIMLVKDSVITKKGVFSIKGYVDEPIRATIQMRSLDADQYDPGWVQYFFLDKGSTTIQGKNLEIAQIKGTKVQADYIALTEQLQPLKNKMNQLTEKMALPMTKEEKAGVPLVTQIKAVLHEMDVERDRYYLAHPDSWVSLHGFKTYDNKFYLYNPESSIILGTPNILDLPESVAEFETGFNQLSERLRNSKDGRKIVADIASAKRIAVGQLATGFSQLTSGGETFALESLKGKYVLIDFWSSWCKPCRAENPNLIKAYNQFKDKNFEIVGVSVDTQRDAWLKAINKDGLPWINVSDLKGLNNSVAVSYNIMSVPQNFLIDPNGVIVAKDLHGSELTEKLQELIK